LKQLEVIPRGLVAGCSAETGVSYGRTWTAIRAGNWDTLTIDEEVALRHALMRRLRAARPKLPQPPNSTREEQF
jgi:hypothetical protein